MYIELSTEDKEIILGSNLATVTNNIETKFDEFPKLDNSNEEIKTEFELINQKLDLS